MSNKKLIEVLKTQRVRIPVEAYQRGIDYAIRAIEEHSNKQEQKQALIEMMEGDEELGIYEKPIIGGGIPWDSLSKEMQESINSIESNLSKQPITEDGLREAAQEALRDNYDGYYELRPEVRDNLEKALNLNSN